jgi:uncharacterized hydrophobic protein (TIGR00271 family)
VINNSFNQTKRWQNMSESQAPDSEPEPNEEPKFEALLQRLKHWQQLKYVQKINHQEVVEHVREEGGLTSRYSFMTIISSAIAILGLLLSSPAVVIGAMLISPLMGPIISLGFSLCLLDSAQMRKALIGLIAGVFLALAISWLIVSISPLSDATPEIMARTRPNLFDLLVAIFSGLAGGYSVIKRKGEGIVGVAIATALMPPLAVTGFGLATYNMAIASGAFMLLMTNLLAIALSVTLLAKFYGFGSGHGGKHTAWQILLVLFVFGVLSLPLGVALKDITYQTYVTKMVKGTITEYFGGAKSHISLFDISFSTEGGTLVDTVVLTPKYKPKAQEEISALLAEKTSNHIDLSLDQLVVADDIIKEATPAPSTENKVSSPLLQPKIARLSHEAEMTLSLEQAVFFPTQYIKVDAESRKAILFAKAQKGVNLITLHRFEESLLRRHPGWDIAIIPPMQALPYLYFATGSTALSEAETAKLNDIIWALKRWDAHEWAVLGYASSTGDSDQSSLAYKRAEYVLEALQQAGIKALAKAVYAGSDQRKNEVTQGLNSFQRVEIRLRQSADELALNQ